MSKKTTVVVNFAEYVMATLSLAAIVMAFMPTTLRWVTPIIAASPLPGWVGITQVWCAVVAVALVLAIWRRRRGRIG